MFSVAAALIRTEQLHVWSRDLLTKPALRIFCSLTTFRHSLAGFAAGNHSRLIVNVPTPYLSMILLLASSPTTFAPQQSSQGSPDSTTVINPYFAKAIQLAETDNIQQLRGTYNNDIEDWDSTLIIPPFTNCLIDKDTDEGSTVYSLSCIKRFDSDEGAAAFADVIESGVAAHPGITKTSARDYPSTNRHTQGFRSGRGALISVRRPINNKNNRHIVSLSIQPPVKM